MTCPGRSVYMYLLGIELGDVVGVGTDERRKESAVWEGQGATCLFMVVLSVSIILF